MDGLIIRFDDVCERTYEPNLMELMDEVSGYGEIWLSVNLFSSESESQSVYPDVPFKDKPNSYFFNVNEMYRYLPTTQLQGIRLCPDYKVVSHGLLHADHSRLSKDAQEMSIVSSCRLLNTDIFVPPFNRWDSTTEEVCGENGISLIKITDGWKSMEHNQFDRNHKLWYLHPWKWNSRYELRKYLNGSQVSA